MDKVPLLSGNSPGAYPTQAVCDEPFARRVKERAGRGRACLRVWPQLCIATVIKRTEKKRVVEVTRQMALGTLKYAQVLLAASQGGTVLNTALIERLNGSATSTYLLTLSEATHKEVCW